MPLSASERSDLRYGSSADPYVYPTTTVLKNKAGIRDPEELSQFELAKFLARTRQPWPDGRLDKAHYYAFHRHLFQDIYDWAGKPRTIRTGKGGNWFCFPDFIDSELDRLFSELKAKRHLVGLDLDAFAREAAWFVSELNAIHPFREGNGRTQLAFLRLLCLNAGFAFNAPVLERERVISAMIDSFDGRLEGVDRACSQISRQSPEGERSCSKPRSPEACPNPPGSQSPRSYGRRGSSKARRSTRPSATPR